MIDLSKSQCPESSREAMQVPDNRVYDYALDLYANSNLNWDNVREVLIKRGLDSNDADMVVDNLRKRELEEKRKDANKEIGYGILLAVGGTAVSVIPDVNVIFSGAIVVGIWLLITGLYHKIFL